MQLTIVLRLRKGPGEVARVAGAFSNLGLTYIGHDVHLAPADQLLVKYWVTAETQPEDLRDRMLALPGVVEFVEAGESHEQESQHASVGEAGPIDPWVERVVREYPQVLPVLEAFAQDFARAEREHRLTKLGLETGLRIAPGLPSLNETASVDQFLSTVALPALKGLVEGRIDGMNLRVTDSVLVCRDFDLMFTPIDPNAGYCCFLTGLLSGLVRSARRLPSVRVKEIACIDKGDGHCHFTIDIVNP